MSQKRPSPARPICAHYVRRKCTGCTRLHVPYEAQIDAKDAWVRETLKPVLAGVTPGRIAPSPSRMGYRTSVKLCLNEDREGRRSIGLYRQGSHDVAHVPDCPAAHAQLTKLTATMFRRELRPPARFYDHRGRVFQKGRLKFLIARHAPGGGTGIILVHTGIAREILIAWWAKVGLRDVAVYESRLTPADGSELTGRRVEYLAGPETFKFPLGDVNFELTPDAFFQANHSLSGGLVQAATAFVTDGDVLLDLYGGFGAYSFAVHRRFQLIHVVDGNAGAARAAKRAADRLGLQHLTAHAAMCERFLSDLPVEVLERVTHMIVNPPRQGLSRSVVQSLAVSRLPALRELAYVSCHPETLARDLAAMKTLGFVVRTARPFDMFPQTDHVETVVHLGRPS